mmetsp:Transcript_26679/g.63089  ORF Transcript_26679/g.63089 Transcript_26679/m.63089 type:complete len:202 (-) Transcript_26679:468-1073(-)|eukprot:scaffold48297_cov61-Phaeocystis_antarctica.AAC.1
MHLRSPERREGYPGHHTHPHPVRSTRLLSTVGCYAPGSSSAGSTQGLRRPGRPHEPLECGRVVPLLIAAQPEPQDEAPVIGCGRDWLHALNNIVARAVGGDAAGRGSASRLGRACDCLEARDARVELLVCSDECQHFAGGQGRRSARVFRNRGDERGGHPRVHASCLFRNRARQRVCHDAHALGAVNGGGAAEHSQRARLA